MKKLFLNLLIATCGFFGLKGDEILSLSFVDSKSANMFGKGVDLLAPLNQEMATLRPSVLIGALKAINYNQSKSQNNSAFFEIAKQFQQQAGNHLEKAVVCAVRSQLYNERSWIETERNVDVFDIKFDLENF